MSGPIRTRIGQARRRLRLHIAPVQATLNSESATDATPLRDRKDTDIQEDTNVLIEVRTPFVKAYNSLLKEHEAFEQLRNASPSEENEYKKFIKTYGDYSTELDEASDLIGKLDSLIDKMIVEGKQRNLPMPEEEDDSLTISSNKSIEIKRTTRSSAKQTNPENNGTTDESQPLPIKLPGRTIQNIPDDNEGRVEGRVLDATFEPIEKQSSAQDPHVVYVPTDTASAFVTAALVGKTLPHFSGDILAWPEFLESFESMIKNGRISGADKLSLLNMCLSGEAREIIKGLPKIDRNYEHAILLLKKEYDKPMLRHHSLLTRLRTLPACDSKNLRSFHLKLNVIIRQLLPDGEEDSPDMLVNLITSKLPVPMQTRILKEATRRRDFGVFSVLAILADAVEDEKIERDIMANNRAHHSEHYNRSERNERRSEKHSSQQNQSNNAEKSGDRAPRSRKQFNPTPRPCQLCNGLHKVDSCSQYTTPEDRKTAAIQMNLCLNCLKPNHTANECRNRWRCFKCKESHHTSTCKQFTTAPSPPRNLNSPQNREKTPQNHPKQQNIQSKQPSNRRPQQQQTHCVLTEELFEETTMAIKASEIPPIIDIDKRSSSQPLLCIDTILHSPVNPTQNVKATVMFDTASTCSYITSDLVKLLGLPMIESQKIATRVFGQKRVDHSTTGIYPIGVTLKDGTQRSIATLSTPLICGEINWLRVENDSITVASSAPSLLIGMDLLLEFFFGDNFSMSRTEDGTHIFTTPMGDVASKKRINNRNLLSTILVNPSTAESNPDLANLEEMVKKFFSVEIIGVTDSPETDDDDTRGLAHFLAHIQFNEDEKRYYVALPFRDEDPQLPTNFGLAFRRLITNTTALAQKAENLEKYNAIFEEQVNSGILEPVPDDELFQKEGVHYLSHFGIVKESSNTTKLRAVLDGSAHTKENPSLNSCIYRGPVILPDLFGTLVRSRTTPILISADICKAFLQVGLQEQSRNYTRLLWIRDITKPPSMENLIVYRFRRVPFGLNCSPFLLAGTIQHHLSLNPNEWSELIKDIYVDNYFGHAKTIEEGSRQFHEVREFFAKASFNLREFVSNNQTLNDIFVSNNAAASDLEHAKILGTNWNTTTDSYSLPTMQTPAADTKWTKRRILRHLNGFFDPLGLKTPATLPLKIFFQQLWKIGTEWDAEINRTLAEQWQSLLASFHTPSLSSEVPRLAIPLSIDGCTVEMHLFVDASQHAYAAVAYLVCRQPDGYASSSLLASKARVAPVNCTMNIPRMELMGNLLGAILGNHILKELTTTCKPTEITMWTDSMISLCWIKNESRKQLPTFVRNRTAKINSLLPNAKFHHIEGSLNPADVASRGSTSDELQNHQLWWKGPPFLTKPPNSWIPQPVLSTQSIKETTLAVTHVSTDPIHDSISPIVDTERFSCWTTMINALVLVLIFIQRLRKIPATLSRISHLRKAEQLLFKMSQTEYPPSPHLIQQLRMYQCPLTSLWRCRGRIDNADLPFDTRYPIYLPRESRITRLYILQRHHSINHFGVQHTLTDLRQRVWISKGITTVKSALRHCPQCKRTTAKQFRLPEYPDLPKIRTVQPAHPFSAVGMDLAGPMQYKTEEGKHSKFWIIVLTCLHIRATFLDVITDMSVKTLLSRIRRFVAAYGSPSTIYCDNAASFVALNRLQEQFEPSSASEKTDITDYCARAGIEFHFVTPLSPWSGGVYERVVALTKSSLKSVLGKKMLPLEELTTLVKETEAILNSRPLTSSGSDIDFLPLRPSDFLRPYTSLSLPRLQNERAQDDDDAEWRPRQTLRDTVLDSWTHSMKLLNRLWKRWQQEYLTSLRERYKRNHDQGRLVNNDSPQYDDVVIIADPALERGQWKLGRIIQVNNGRSAIVKTATGTLHRPLSLLYKLEIDAHDTSSTEIEENPRANNDDAPNPVENRPLRRSARLNPTLTLLTTLALLSTVGATTDSKCPQATSAHLQMLYVTNCSQHGFGVATTRDTATNTQTVCWLRMQCPTGHLRMPNPNDINTNYCGPECKCPQWTRTCSFYSGKHVDTSSIYHLPSELKSYQPNHVCSFKREDHCDPNAIFGLFSQIELMDGNTVVVPELDIATTDVYSPDDHRCYDMNGKELLHFALSSHTPVIGSSSFCQVHTCTTTDKATAFCFYGEKVTSYVFLDRHIPIRAWGTTRKLYYPRARNNTLSNQSPITMQCAQLGIAVRPQAEASQISIRACINVYCIFLEELHPTENPIQFPWSLVSEDHEIVIQSWTEGIPNPDEKIHCKGRPTCERLRCKLCISFAFSPSCWSYIDSVIFVFSTLLLGYIISRILDICKIVSYCYRGTRRILCFFIRRNPINPSQSRTNPSQLLRARRIKWKRNRLSATALAIALLSITPTTRSCSEVSSIKAEDHECTRSTDGILHCTISNSAVLTLRPLGQSSCLIVRDSNGNIGTMITIRVDRISHKCDKQTMFYSRSHEFSTRSHHVCGEITNSGTCDGIKCNSVNSSAPISFFESTLPGYNFCASSCGCITCGGCFSCSPSCVFYRIGASPTSQTIFEAFRCLQWNNHVEIQITMETNGNEKSSYSMDLGPGQTHRWNDLTATLLSTSIAHSPILSSHFLTDGTRTCLIEDAAPSIFTPGSAGQLQCGTKEEANDFRCHFLPTACTCSTSSTSASCSCPDGDLERFFKKAHRTLPLEREGLQLVANKEGIEAYTTDNQVLQLKVNFDSLLLETMIDINECDITTSSATGCYNCIAGASIDTNCISSASDTSTSFKCTDPNNITLIDTIIKCNTKGNRQTTTFSSSTNTIQLNCIYRCPGEGSQAKSTTINGELQFVDEVDKNPVNMATDSHTSENKAVAAPSLNFDFFSSFSIVHTTVIILIIATTIIAITYFVLSRGVCTYERRKNQ